MQHLDHVTVRCDALDEAVDRSDVTLDRHPTAFRCDPRLGVGSEASFGLVEASLEQLLSLVQPGVAHLEVLATRRQRGRVGLELGAQLSTGAGGIGLGLLVGFERRQQRFEFRDALFVAHDVGGDVVDRPFEVLELGFGLSVLSLRLGQPLGRCAEASVVRVETASQLGLGRTGRLERSLRRRDGFGRTLERRFGFSRPFERIVERRRGGSAPGSSDAPAAETEPVATRRDHHRIGMAQRGVDRRAQVVDADRRPEQAVEQHVDAGARRPGMRPYRVADGRARLAGGTSAQRDHGAAGVRAPQRIERAATRRWIVDDDRGQRLAERRLDGGLPTGVDLDQIEQRAEHTVDAGEAFGAGAGPGSVERELERLHAAPRTERPPRQRRCATTDGPRGSRSLRPAPLRPLRPRRRVAPRSLRLRRTRSGTGAHVPSSSLAWRPVSRSVRGTDEGRQWIVRATSAPSAARRGPRRRHSQPERRSDRIRRPRSSSNVRDGTPPRRRPAPPTPVRSRPARRSPRRVPNGTERRRPRGSPPRRRRAVGPCRAPTNGGVRPGPRRARGHAREAARRAPGDR